MAGKLTTAMQPARLTLLIAALLAAAGLLASGCRTPPAKRYAVTGQVLSVNRERQLVTVKHESVAGLMPGMTMSFPVSKPELLDGREAGELITGILEVTDAVGRLTSIVRVGFEPLPANSNAADMAGSILDVGEAMPDAAFIDQANTRRAFSDWRGTPVVVTFIYTRCPLPQFCPLMDRNFARLQEGIAADAALRGRVKLVSISFDPDYDTPATLAAHAKALRADPATWTFLTGDKATVEKFAAAMGVGVLRDATDPTTITHNLRTILVGSDGRIVRIYGGNEWTTAGVLADLRAAGRAP